MYLFQFIVFFSAQNVFSIIFLIEIIILNIKIWPFGKLYL